MSWEEIAFGELLTVKHGWAFKSQHFEDDGPFVLVTPGNFFEEGGFKLRPGKDRSYSGEFAPEYLLGEGDLIVAMTEQSPGLLGSTALIPEAGRFLHNQRIGLIRVKDEQRTCKSFLYYLFNTSPVRGQIDGSATGTKVRHTAPERIYRVRAMVPELSVQKRIVQILSAYDELIENNRKRIILLEMTARLLYREWFLHFRFPGHETVNFVEGMPEGWKISSLGDLVLNFDRLRIPMSVMEREQRQGPYPYHGAAGVLDFVDGFIFDGRYLLLGEDGTVITKDGHPMLQLVQGKFWVSNHAHVLQGEMISTEYLWCCLNSYQISGHVTGVAQPKITQKNMNRIPITLPGAETAAAFDAQIKPIVDQIFSLRSQNTQLTKARDLLLPRLMDGRVPV